MLASSTTGTLTWIAPGGSGGSLNNVDIQLAAGTAAAPSLTFYADTQTGLYQGTFSTLDVTTAGVERAVFDGSGNFDLTGTTGAYEINANPVLVAPSADTATSIAVGIGALNSDTIGNSGGTHNTGVGYEALYKATTGTNSAFGYLAGQYISTGSHNTAVGTNAMVGVSATPLTSSGGYNTGVGDTALTAIEGAAADNTALGYESGEAVSIGTDNTLLGYQSGKSVTIGAFNIIVGEAGNISTGSSNILIGNNLADTTATSSDQIDIGDTIFGNTSTGYVGIGTGATAPAAALDVVGQVFSLRYPLTYGSTIAVNWANGNTQSVTLTGNPTFTFTGGQDGGRYVLIIKQDLTGSRTVTWPSSSVVRWPGGTPPTLTTTGLKTDYIGFIYNGVSSTYDGVAMSQNF